MDKEARELRLENDSLLTSLDTRVSDIQSELTLAYKEKASLAEKFLHATKQLSVVRGNFDHQQKELEEAHNEIQALKDAINDLNMELDLSREALHTASNEATAAAAESAAISERAAELGRENLELAHRLVELKSKEIERMNEINKTREEIIEKARQDAGSILDEARSQMLRSTSTSQQDGGISSPVSALGRLSFLEEDGLLSSLSSHHSLPSTSKRYIPSAHPGGVFNLAFTSTGNLLASCGADKTAKLWNPITHTCTATLHGSFEGVNAVTFTSDSKLLLGAESRQAVRVWNVVTGRLVQSLTGHTGKVTSVTANPINTSAVASCATDRSIKLWGLEKGYCIKTLLCHSTPNCVVYTSDASLLVSSHFDGSLRVWDPKSGKMTTELTSVHSGQAGGIAVSPDGVTIITVGKDNVVKVIDARTFSEKMALTASSSSAYSVGATWAQPAISPNGSYVAVGSSDGKVVVWDLSTGGVVKMLGGGEGDGDGDGRGAKRDGKAVLACRWSPKGLPLVSGSINGGLTFWGGGL